MNINLVPMGPVAPGGSGNNLISGVNSASGQAATAMQSAGFVVVLAILIYIVARSRGAFAALVTGGLGASLAYWLVKMDGLATLGAAWSSTITAFFS